ncbi:glutathione S-transferase family protein [Salinisphaera sp. SPP-AMP-43]|uniref:glutathione S-transferase family protein n=1 Tax=Salinisphaera sp. SPP-AMP-43 TaxID=3121288 RepID=UPI003C6E2BCD
MSAILYGHRLSQPCRAVEILLREIGMPYHWQEIDFAHGQTHETWFAERINPFETIPALAMSAETEQATDSPVLGESHAILRYICRTAEDIETAHRWYPGDTDRGRSGQIDQWLAWHHGHIRRYDMFHDIMNLHLTLPMLKREIRQTALRPLQQGLNTSLAVLERHFERQPDNTTHAPTLASGPHPTLADLSLSCELYQIVAVGYRFDRYPRVSRWLDAMAQRPHFQDVSEQLLEQGTTIRQQNSEYLDLANAFG